MINPIIITFFLVECFLLALVGGFIFKWSPKPFSEYVKYAISLALITYVVRLLFYNFLHLPMPSHIIVLILLSVLLMRYVFNISFNSAIGATLSSYVIIIVGDSLLMPVILNLFKWSVIEIQSNPLKYIITGLLSEMPMFIVLMYMLFKRRFKIFNESYSKVISYTHQ